MWIPLFVVVLIQIQFGSLSDYFKAVDEFSSKVSNELSLPTLSGDFMTYNDRDDQYWSGYYTSRPFFKAMVRHLYSQLR